MLRTFLIIGIMLTLPPLAFSQELAELQTQWVEHVIAPGTPAMHKLREDINFYNLINGLHLTTPQITGLLLLAQQNKRLQERYFGKDKSPSLMALKQELAALQRMKEFAQNGKDIPSSTGRQSKARAAAQGGIDNQKRYMQELRQLESQAEKLLIPAQKQVLADYKACLIPPQNLKNPVRIGQVATSQHELAWLSRMRQVSKLDYNFDMVLQKHLAMVEEHFGPYSPEERRQMLQQWREVVNQIQKMSEAEFEVSKAELAEKIRPLDKKKKLQDIVAQEVKDRDLPGKIARFLLTPAIIPVLRERLAQMLQPAKENRTDLSKWKQNKDCQDDDCED